MNQGNGNPPHQIMNFLPGLWDSVPRNFGGMVPLGEATVVPPTCCRIYQRKSRRYSGPPSLGLVWSLDSRSVGLGRTERGHCSRNLALMMLLSNDAG